MTLRSPSPGDDVTSFLSGVRPFAPLDASLRATVEAHMTERNLAAGEPLMRQGEIGDSLWIVLDGEVDVVLEEGGRRHVLDRAGRGGIFGEMALLTEEPRTATVVATTPVRAMVLAAEEFHRLARRHPQISIVLTDLVANRLGGDDTDALAGKLLEGYRIRRRIGRGGMAIVYEADEVATEARVALKMMSHRFVYDSSATERFKREADIVAGFRHPNIARMLGRFAAFHTFFIVMEFCDGITLADAIRRAAPIPEEAVRPIVGQLAAAMAYADRAGIIHRDIKPGNVMVDRDGVVKLMDFGLAGPREELGTEGHPLAGTPLYMAPEQLAGRSFGREVDVYAAGCVAWELLTGRRPFEAEGMADLAKQHEAWALPDIAALCSGLSQPMREFLAGCLQKDPRRRSVDLAAIARWASPADFSRLA